MRIIVSASSSLQYYAYYLTGIRSVLGRVKTDFGRQDLPKLTNPREGLCVVLASGARLYFAADDFSTVNSEALEWCDAYGQVNMSSASRSLPGGHKIVPLGPGFGVRWEPATAAWRYATSAAFKGRQFAGAGARLKAFTRHQFGRAPLSSYEVGTSDPNYVFFLATYWSAHPEANHLRASLWSTVHSGVVSRAEGGFVGAPREFEPMLCARRRYSIDEYLTKTQRSVAALNTPAVHGCLGWKLGEFLALGKAVISMPIENELPGSFTPGRHFLQISGAAEAAECLLRLSDDAKLRGELEHNARRYFDDFVAPQAAVRRMLAHAAETRRV